MKIRKHPPLNRPPPLAMDPPYDQRLGPYLTRWITLAKPLVEFTSEDLGLTPSEARLFFGTTPIEVLGEMMTTSLWDFLHRPFSLKLLRRVAGPGMLESRGWSLVEALRVGKRKNRGVLPGGSLLVWNGESKVWDWVQGELRFEKVQQGLSLWGILRHTRTEEWERSK